MVKYRVAWFEINQDDFIRKTRVFFTRENAIAFTQTLLVKADIEIIY